MEDMRNLSTICVKCDCFSALFVSYWVASIISIIAFGFYGNLSEQNYRWRCYSCIGAICV
jgi:hypothetical protein